MKMNPRIINIISRPYSSIRRSAVEDVFIVGHARTPLGSFQGQLQSLSATRLGSIAIENAIKATGIDKSAIEEVYMGCVVQSGLGQAPARQAALGAGLSNTTPCATVNKVCASALKAITMATAQLAVGHRNVMIAGGMESLSNSPFLLERGSTPYGGINLKDSCSFDALTDAYSGWHMGKCAENTAEKLNISKDDQDDYGILSYRRTEKAIEDGVFHGEIYPLEVRKGKITTIVTTDEEVSRNDYETFRETKLYWGKTVAVGSSSKLADGATATILANETGLKMHNLKPLARVIAYSDSAVNPVDWPVAPAKGIQDLLNRAGMKKEDISKWEINEAFAVVVLANARILDLNLEDVNVHGGAISVGHPFGMSGGRITNHLVHTLNSGEFGVASLCNGGGGAGSILVQKL
ncbi:acetyl-CoA acetyltransferase, mitochondrial [Eurytemora carolleeae]|uniref:acetyl-CoA acetyltransferase, mitochondrial n=1 Tax=Eurytemora carolleeae TaxID=1294199 RepID=UPI000C766AD1|nr:acetyl-CoA acetyltransferase, mitochondrial [Eurytemora carolleeae]|eukprot:XP_023331190.1 acetyl-CoA acetyltransferase, mitochondrial-like [Eurytemora affinis]